MDLNALTIHHNTMDAPPPPPPPPPIHKPSFMHIAFFWGKNTEFLFSGWPGSSSVMYALSLIFVFALAVLVEWLSRCEVIKSGSNRVAWSFFKMGVHTVRAGFAYMVMLAVMSYNGGVFIAAVLGHAVGFLFFGSGLFKKGSNKPTGH